MNSPIAPFLQGLLRGEVRVHDLTNILSPQTPALRLPEPFKNLEDFSRSSVAAFDDYAPFWSHANIALGEHVGTHLDAPAHWISGRDGRTVDQIEPQRLVGPAAVMDVSDRASADPDLLLEPEDIQAWIAEHGPMEPGTWLLVRTGWDAYSRDEKAFLNTDETGSHTPGFSAACAQWLSEQDWLSGVGVETVGIDQGNAGALDPAFPMHYHLLAQDKYGVTSLQGLGELPPTGAMVVVAPLPIEGGTGGPCRVLAFSSRQGSDGSSAAAEAAAAAGLAASAAEPAATAEDTSAPTGGTTALEFSDAEDAQ